MKRKKKAKRQQLSLTKEQWTVVSAALFRCRFGYAPREQVKWWIREEIKRRLKIQDN